MAGFVLFGLGTLAELAGGGIMLASCVTGDARAEVALAPRPGPAAGTPAWGAQASALTLRRGADVGVDVWLDYNGSGTIAYTVTAVSARGARWTGSADLSDNDGGNTFRAFKRVGPFRPGDAGPWRIQTTVTPADGIQIDHGEVVIREGVVDTLLPGIAVLALGSPFIGIGIVLLARRRAAV